MSTIEKKHSAADFRTKELEDTLRRVRATAVEDQNAESERIKDHFTKLVQRLEE